MKQSLVMLTIVALLGLPLAVWAETNDELFQSVSGKADVSQSVETEKAAEEAVYVSETEIASPAPNDAEKPREYPRDETFIMW